MLAPSGDGPKKTRNFGFTLSFPQAQDVYAPWPRAMDDNLIAIDAAIAAAGGAGGGLEVSSVALSAAQLLALNGTPVQLVAAQGAGKVVIPFMIVLEFIPNTTPFTVGGANILIINGTNVGYGGGPGSWSGLIDQTVKTLYSGAQFPPSVPVSVAANAPLTIGSSDVLSAGDGSLIVTTYYQVLTIS
jgi:hypothetical protein